MSTVFIYYKQNKIKALGIADAQNNNALLIHDGWKHTATLDACIFIEKLFNDSEDVDIVATVRELKNF